MLSSAPRRAGELEVPALRAFQLPDGTATRQMSALSAAWSATFACSFNRITVASRQRVAHTLRTSPGQQAALAAWMTAAAALRNYVQQTDAEDAGHTRQQIKEMLRAENGVGAVNGYPPRMFNAADP